MSLQLSFRPGAADDVPACLALDHTCESDSVWQMTLNTAEHGQTQVTFKREHLPRLITLKHMIEPARLKDDLDAGLLWAVAVPEEGMSQSTTAEITDGMIEAPSAPSRPILGYVVARFEDSQSVVWIDDLIVTREARRKRAGTRLLDGVRVWAREQGAHSLMVALPTKHAPMIQLVQGFGLTFCGYNDLYFKNHDIAVVFGMRITRRDRVG